MHQIIKNDQAKIHINSIIIIGVGRSSEVGGGGGGGGGKCNTVRL